MKLFSVDPCASPALTAVLYDLSRQIPLLKKDIQDGLLKMLSLVLMHKPLRHPGMPKGLAHQLASPSLTNIPEASDVGSITLALRTLGSFEFEGTTGSLLTFVFVGIFFRFFFQQYFCGLLVGQRYNNSVGVIAGQSVSNFKCLNLKIFFILSKSIFE